MCASYRSRASQPEHGDIADWIEAHGDAAEPDVIRAELESLVTASEPANEQRADGCQLQFRPFPTGALPEPMREFVRAGARTMAAILRTSHCPALAVVASAIGSSRRLRLKPGWDVPAILWTAIIGESGTTKTPAFQLAMRPIRARQRERLERYAEDTKRHGAEVARWERDNFAWKRSKTASCDPPPRPEAPPPTRFVVSDTTVEALAPILQANPRGVLLARDELAGWIGSFDRYASGRHGDAAHWLSMHVGEAITVDRKTGPSRLIYVPTSRIVSITGCIQPGILQRVMTTEHREDGLLARLLVTYPPKRPKRWTEDSISRDVEAAMETLVAALLDLQDEAGEDGHVQTQIVRPTPDAHGLWVGYYDRHAGAQADASGDLAAALSKLEEYAARLALVVHCCRVAYGDATQNNPLELDAKSMASGIALADWFQHEARRVYAMFAEGSADRERRKLMDWIVGRGGSVTPRDLMCAFASFRQPMLPRNVCRLLSTLVLAAGKRITTEAGEDVQCGDCAFWAMPAPDTNSANAEENRICVSVGAHSNGADTGNVADFGEV